jgi:hypothetical protein
MRYLDSETDEKPVLEEVEPLPCEADRSLAITYWMYNY